MPGRAPAGGTSWGPGSRSPSNSRYTTEAPESRRAGTMAGLELPIATTGSAVAVGDRSPRIANPRPRRRSPPVRSRAPPAEEGHAVGRPKATAPIDPPAENPAQDHVAPPVHRDAVEGSLEGGVDEPDVPIELAVLEGPAPAPALGEEHRQPPVLGLPGASLPRRCWPELPAPSSITTSGTRPLLAAPGT